MLILTRKQGEEIDIELEDGRVIVVALLSVERCSGRTKIGVKADRSIKVDRHEVYLRKANENAGA